MTRQADKLMRKASEHFSRRRTQEAYDAYGEAIARYGVPEGPERLRPALAHYTRAMLVLMGDAVGDVEADIEAGAALVAEGSEPEVRRFRGLFHHQRGVHLARAEALEEARTEFRRARPLLEECGRPTDVVELERELALLLSEIGEPELAREAAERAIRAAVGVIPLLVRARRTLAEVMETAGDLEGALSALGSAYGGAVGTQFVPLRIEIEEQIDALRRRHDLPAGPTEPAPEEPDDEESKPEETPPAAS
ncbi:MAG: hypothetical protein R3F20_00855 [Planctomycetota bacterium]